MITMLPCLAQHSTKRKRSNLDEARAKEAKFRAKKHVTFAADTVVNPARGHECFYRHARNKEQYQPGKHAALLGIE